MSLAPLNAIYQARFNRYLLNQGIKDASEHRVWAFLGDGEMDEPESLDAIGVAARDGLDNLTFVINCNLQRLDEPVRETGRSSRSWRRSSAAPAGTSLRSSGVANGIALRKGRRRRSGQPDEHHARCDFQTYKAESGAFVREHFLGRDPRTRDMVQGLTVERIWGLKRGGHDYRKLYAAYRSATEHQGQPTVILAKTIKGWRLGSHFEGRNSTHQLKTDARLPVSQEVEELVQAKAMGAIVKTVRSSRKAWRAPDGLFRFARRALQARIVVMMCAPHLLWVDAKQQPLGGAA